MGNMGIPVLLLGNDSRENNTEILGTTQDLFALVK